MRNYLRNAFRKDVSPLDDYKVAAKGAGAESIRQTFGPILGQEAESIFRQLATCKPDLGTYAHLAGQALIIQKILTSVDVTLSAAKEAADRIRKTGT